MATVVPTGAIARTGSPETRLPGSAIAPPGGEEKVATKVCCKINKYNKIEIIKRFTNAYKVLLKVLVKVFVYL